MLHLNDCEDNFKRQHTIWGKDAQTDHPGFENSVDTFGKDVNRYSVAYNQQNYKFWSVHLGKWFQALI